MLQSSSMNTIYDNYVGLSIKYIDYERNVNKFEQAEPIRFIIKAKGTKPNITLLRINLQSDSDPFFSSYLECTAERFQFIKQEQKLVIDFQELPALLMKCLNSVSQQDSKENTLPPAKANEQHTKSSNTSMFAELLMYSDGKSRLSLSQNSPLRRIQMLSLELQQLSQQEQQKQIKMKYLELKGQLKASKDRLEKVAALVYEKNPTLLEQLVKIKNLDKVKAD